MRPDWGIRGKHRVRHLVRDPDDGAARELMSDQRSELQRSIAERLGLLPNFFCTATSAPGLIDRLWDFARSAYFDSPLPSVFKERLFVHLSRFCEVRYCIVRHVGFLIGHGYPAGDQGCPPQTIDHVVALLRRPVPGETALADAIRRLQEAEPTIQMPAPETQREADLFDVLSLIFLEPRQSLSARRAVGRAFGDASLEMLIAFLAFVRTAHYWTETHPELEYEADMLLLMQQHGLLAQLLLNQSEAERTWSPMERARLLSALAAHEAELRELNEGLENQVQERTRELRAAEAELRELNGSSRKRDSREDAGVAGDGGGAPPVPENGGGWPAHRRTGARFQQHAHRDQRQPGTPAGAHRPRQDQRNRALHFGGPGIRRSARRP